MGLVKRTIEKLVNLLLKNSSLVKLSCMIASHKGITAYTYLLLALALTKNRKITHILKSTDPYNTENILSHYYGKGQLVAEALKEPIDAEDFVKIAEESISYQLKTALLKMSKGLDMGVGSGKRDQSAA